jgi:hypothetical protein
MGAKTALLVYAEGDVASALRDAVEVDRAATESLVARLLPGLEVIVVEDGNLGWNINPPGGVVYAGVFPGLTVICAAELGELRPSFLRPGWRAEGAGRRVILHSMHSVRDFLGFAVWGPRRNARAGALSEPGSRRRRGSRRQAAVRAGVLGRAAPRRRRRR